MDKLGQKLVSIENKLGGTEPMPVGVQDKLGWHLDYIENLIDESGGGGVTDIKVDDTSIVSEEGVANIVTKTAYNPSTNKLATEADLGGGGSVYMHKLTFTSNEDQHIIVYTSSSTPFTSNTWYWWLRNNGFTNKTNCLPIILNDKSISKSGDTKLVVHSGLYASANSPYCTRFDICVNITPGTGVGSITYEETGTTPNRDIVIEM